MAELNYADVIDRDRRARALAELGKRFAAADLAKLMPRLVECVAVDHLAILAETRSILNEDGYWLAESDSARRRLIKGAYELHRYKGTPWAIREIVRRLGFGEVEIVEGLDGKYYDGEITYNGRYGYGSRERWAHYVVTMNNPITNGQAAVLRQTLQAFAPARCVLVALDYQAVPLRYNGAAQFDGSFNYGKA